MTNPCQGHAAESARAEYLKEAERLLNDFALLVQMNVAGLASMAQLAEARAALLAHIQRGAVPEGWQLVPKEPTPEMISYTKSVEHCGSREPHTSNIYRAMLAAAPAPDQFRDAAKMMAEPAEVPMPEPVAYGFGNTAITGHTSRLMMVRIDIPLDDQYAGALWLPLVLAEEAQTYGAACRAAGEAVGYAQGLRDAVRGADIEALRLIAHESASVKQPCAGR